MPLFSDLKVLELATVLAGPAVGQFFAELGAEVLKVEPPGGDVTRTWRMAGETADDSRSAYFSSVNWGKRSIVLDLRTPAGRTALARLAADADVVLSNFKPGDAEKLGADYATLSAANPRLVYAHLTGYGSHSARPGYDAVVQAEAGFLHLNGQPEGPPTKMPVALMDLLAAHQLKEAVLCALYARMRTGQGCFVTVSLIQAAVASLANQSAAWLWAGQSPQRIGSEHPSIVPYGTVLTAADGRDLILAVGSDRQFADLCAVLALPQLPADDRYATNPARVVHRNTLLPLLAAAVSLHPREGLLQALAAANVPAGAVHDVPEACALPAVAPLLLGGADSKPRGVRTAAFDDPGGWFAPALAPPPPLQEV